MKGESDVVAHVASATGLGEQEVRRVVDAAFAFLSASALAGEEISHPSLGAIRPRQREKDGSTVTVYRFRPAGAPEAPSAPKRGGGRKGGRGKAAGDTGGGGRRGGRGGGRARGGAA